MMAALGVLQPLPVGMARIPEMRVAMNASATAGGACARKIVPAARTASASTSVRPRASSSFGSCSMVSSRACAGAGADRRLRHRQLVHHDLHRAGSRCSTRATSSAMTLPEPSQMELTGTSR